MGKFKVEVQEVSSKIIEVEAEELDEAIEQIKKMYLNEEIILNHDDFLGACIEFSV